MLLLLALLTVVVDEIFREHKAKFLSLPKSLHPPPKKISGHSIRGFEMNRQGTKPHKMWWKASVSLAREHHYPHGMWWHVGKKMLMCILTDILNNEKYLRGNYVNTRWWDSTQWIQGKIAYLESMVSGHCTTLLGYVIAMRTSYFDIDFVSQIKLTKFPLIHCSDLSSITRRQEIVSIWSSEEVSWKLSSNRHAWRQVIGWLLLIAKTEFYYNFWIGKYAKYM